MSYRRRASQLVKRQAVDKLCDGGDHNMLIFSSGRGGVSLGHFRIMERFYINL
jgi:hypothetical protein